MSGYMSVYRPGYLCPSASPGTWLTETGKEYARALRRSGAPPCPED
jgi:hypothetical protein